MPVSLSLTGQRTNCRKSGRVNVRQVDCERSIVGLVEVMSTTSTTMVVVVEEDEAVERIYDDEDDEVDEKAQKGHRQDLANRRRRRL